MKFFGVSSLARCRRGIAAIEFAMVFPFMLMVFLGGVVGFDIFRHDRNVTLASTTVVDLMSRFSKISQTDLDNILNVAEVLASSADGTVKLRIANVEFLDGEYQVVWSRHKNWGEIRDADLDSFDLPTINEFDTILIAQIHTRYVPLLKTEYFSSIDIGNIAFRRPLLVDYIEMND